MYKTTKHIKQFDLNNPDETQEYEEVLNNPLCTVIQTVREKLTEKVFDEESGKMTYMKERLVVVATWQEKALV